MILALFFYSRDPLCVFCAFLAGPANAALFCWKSGATVRQSTLLRRPVGEWPWGQWPWWGVGEGGVGGTTGGVPGGETQPIQRKQQSLTPPAHRAFVDLGKWWTRHVAWPILIKPCHHTMIGRNRVHFCLSLIDNHLNSWQQKVADFWHRQDLMLE